MKCRFKTNKILTAVKETDHTITTSEGNLIHKRLASKPIKFQLPKKPEEQRKPTSRCRRCGEFRQGEYCLTHKGFFGMPNNPDEAGCSYSLPTMPHKRSMYGDIITTSTPIRCSPIQLVPEQVTTPIRATVTAE